MPLTGTCQCGVRGPLAADLSVEGCRCRGRRFHAGDTLSVEIVENAGVPAGEVIFRGPSIDRAVRVVDVAKPRRRRAAKAGGAAERALYLELVARGFVDVGKPVSGSAAADRIFARSFAWALDAEPPREFRSDFALFGARLLVEIDGGAHRASRRQLAHDTERRRVAVACGWTVLPFTPEEVREGRAISDILAHLRRAVR